MSETLSAPSPLCWACNTTVFYYRTGSQFPSVRSLLDDSNIKDNLLSPLARAALQCCFLYFTRITEILNATIADIIIPDRLVLHGIKHSNSYVIYLPGLSKQVTESGITISSTCIFPISYIKLYRAAIKIGINLRVSGSVNSRRLHCARYIFSKQSSKTIVGSELAGVLRHRSRTSYLNYLK